MRPSGEECEPEPLSFIESLPTPRVPPGSFDGKREKYPSNAAGMTGGRSCTPPAWLVPTSRATHSSLASLRKVVVTDTFN